MKIALRENNWSPAEVEMVAVATGPGSFTGLRLGVTSAKVFAYAVGARVQGVNTLEGIAWHVSRSGLSDESARIRVVMDAQRNQVFSMACFMAELSKADYPKPSIEILDDDAWLQSLEPGDLLAGPGLNKFGDLVNSKNLPTGVSVAPSELWRPSATAIGQLAWRDFERGQTSADVWSLMPRYYRQSAAEEKRAKEESGRP